MGLDTRLHRYFQEFESIHSGVEFGVVYRVITTQGTTLVGSSGELTTFSGIREGNNLGSIYHITM